MPYLPDAPLPAIELENKGFWEGCKRHELVIRKCIDCGTYRYYGGPVCPKCRSRNARWSKVSGKGTVWGYTIVSSAPKSHPNFPSPYNILLVTLDEQDDILLLSNCIDCQPSELYVGMSVEATFEDITPDFTMFYWKKAGQCK